MRQHRTTLAVLVGAATMTAATLVGLEARADVLGSSALGPFRYDVPAGFTIYKTTATGVDMRGPKGAVISIRVGLRGSDALSVARSVVPDEATEETKEVAIQVSGRPGHLIVRKSPTRIFASAACVPGLGRGVAIVLGAPAESYRESCVPWGQVVDGGRVLNDSTPESSGTAAAPARRSPPPPPVEARQPAKHWVELKNISDQTASTCVWDGRSVTLGAGASERLEATAGVHSFRWQNADGTSGEDRYEVPRFTLFKTCGPRAAQPPQPRPQPQAQPRDVQPTSTPDDVTEEEKEAARWFMNLACFAIFTVKLMDEWTFKPEDIHKDSVILPIVRDIKNKPEFAEFCRSIPGFWETLKSKWNSGDADLQYLIRRDAAAFLRANCPDSYPIPADDGKGGDELDRLLRKERQQWDQIRAMRTQAATTRAMTANMMSNWMFNNTMNAMTFTPVHW